MSYIYFSEIWFFVERKCFLIPYLTDEGKEEQPSLNLMMGLTGNGSVDWLKGFGLCLVETSKHRFGKVFFYDYRCLIIIWNTQNPRKITQLCYFWRSWNALSKPFNYLQSPKYWSVNSFFATKSQDAVWHLWYHWIHFTVRKWKFGGKSTQDDGSMCEKYLFHLII